MTTLDIELLKTFHTIARLGKFRAAAEHLHKSPAAISVHVQRLETIAGGRLFERDNQSVSLTALGGRVLGSTAPLLRAHERALEELRGSALAGRVTLGVPEEYVIHVIKEILPIFSASWPNVLVEVVTAPSDTLHERVERGSVDMAILSRPNTVRKEAGSVLQLTTPVWVSSLGFVPETTAPLPLALYAAPCSYRAAMIDALNAHDIAWRVVLDTPSGHAVEACIESGLGIAIVDRARLTEHMHLLEWLPPIVEHRIVLLRAQGELGEAVTMLGAAIEQRFCL